ncbi:cAMP-dependent protein kinase catalytic subunit [Ophidiomyces ophidiicola]|uniref:cAMP-dependent protein kinase catalytic subunit n=1 Tax=Ophidiomyces ophidiicola TaxID=1387563 RepID=A0ACB8UYU1_9EURO|nr:cAMP-dependent protein kinase catalytic subunit [Ophidiomyces ophidiicola]KAI1949519.1 cAMP-dependent protein kinase catalytic subunit [Ophidiomyces ophidiicola]KAI1972489.1 cAMP-dependent protein kinase catalytic subunit [Ophidiomyces ophidiicola]KAI2008029.1 cAMP-dependent protein kinase catalytic subunit [Ophidiomyces ophidiicola]KAI2026042.1 cAMP-dependent protein kinase catalytic subunit [Ophidiomyces ophidiicola]
MDCLRDKFVQGQLLDGRFLTVTPLNHGSFGMVFLAQDTLTGEQVAIKCLTKSTSFDPSALTVDERSEEMQCHARLGYHPNIVNMVHSFETHAHIFLVLEYCSMGDLYEAIRVDRGPLETEHVRDFMFQLVGAVEYMHSKGLYHRDIKPENIFLCQDGSMKLGDFGLATRSNWSSEACVGSDRYMAPEQYEPTAAGYAPAQADIWAIGICLLNILFSKNPFVTPTESDVLFADYSRDRQSLFDIFPNMSQDTFEILTHSLAIDPKKRSLSAMRAAIVRAVSFTTDDESLDEFCTEDRNVVPASGYREPLRTPSIQSPQINQDDSFPWTKALQTTPQQAVRQLSVIPDTEVDSEDLFATSGDEGMSWYTGKYGCSSVVSGFDSLLGQSLQYKTQPRDCYHQPELAPVSGSLPEPRGVPIPSMSMVFGKDDQVSKSWSDLWDEDQMENEALELHNRQAHNARTWSQESSDLNVQSPRGLVELDPISSILNSRSGASNRQAHNIPIPSAKQYGSAPSPSSTHFSPSKYSPSKQTAMDKWAALGQKRRNYHPKELECPQSKTKSAMSRSWRRDTGGSVFESENEPPAWKGIGLRNNRQRQPHHSPTHLLSKDWRHDPFQTIKPKKDVCPFFIDDHGLDEEFDFIGEWQDFHI